MKFLAQTISLSNQSLHKYTKYLAKIAFNAQKPPFRTHDGIGIATMLGQMGYSDNEIMAIGRWSSFAFELYIRSARAVRAKTAHKKMEKELAKM